MASRCPRRRDRQHEQPEERGPHEEESNRERSELRQGAPGALGLAQAPLDRHAVLFDVGQASPGLGERVLGRPTRRLLALELHDRDVGSAHDLAGMEHLAVEPRIHFPELVEREHAVADRHPRFAGLDGDRGCGRGGNALGRGGGQTTEHEVEQEKRGPVS